MYIYIYILLRATQTNLLLSCTIAFWAGNAEQDLGLALQPTP